MRKVLVVNTVEFAMNGISSVIVNYYKMLDKKEYRMDFVVNEYMEEEIGREFRAGGSAVYVAKRNKNPFGYMLQLYQIMRKNKYDVIHVHGNSATMAADLLPARLSGCKVRIAHCHNTKCRHRGFHRFLNPIFQRLYTCALSCSLAAGSWIFKPGSYSVLPNGIDVGEYKFSDAVRDEVRGELGLTGRMVLGHVGYMNDAKNHPRLFQLVRDMQEAYGNVHLLCVTGSGCVPGRLGRLMDEYGIRDRVTVLCQRGDVGRLLQAMDVFVFPSKFEGLPVALVEVQASGLPCVVSDAVSGEADITGGMRFLPLEGGNAQWIEAIVSEYGRDVDRTAGYELVKGTLFNIENSSRELEKYYQ